MKKKEKKIKYIIGVLGRRENEKRENKTRKSMHIFGLNIRNVIKLKFKTLTTKLNISIYD
jgi:hypothetical protein